MTAPQLKTTIDFLDGQLWDEDSQKLLCSRADILSLVQSIANPLNARIHRLEEALGRP